MTVEVSKEKLKKEGYTWFDLKEFDYEFYKWLLPFQCNEEKNLKKYFDTLRADSASYNGNAFTAFKETFDTHYDALTKKNELLNSVKNNNHTDSVNKLLGGNGNIKPDKIRISQMWYFSDLNRIVNEDGEIDKFKNYVKNIMMYFFDFNETQEYSFFSPMFTYYDEGCVLQNHSDGTGTGRICALLIYLNETYDENDGGILVLNNTERVVPTFGKVAIIDLQSFDIKHMVTQVTGGIGRYAILSFIKKKEDESINSLEDREKTLM